MKLNKAGWHFPQSRILGLWADVGPCRREPNHRNRSSSGPIPTTASPSITRTWCRGVYELDDFQIRTPTDIIGQHIHLVKFDVTSSDGSGNGFNYEDGTFSPDEVIERIHAIRKQNACIGKDSGDTRDGTFTCPVAKAHPFFDNARRTDHNPTLVCRRRAQQQQNRPHAAHSVYPRSLWTIESPADRSLCWFGD